MTEPRLRAATPADLPRIHQVRHGTSENRLTNPARVTDAEVKRTGEGAAPRFLTPRCHG